MIVAISLTEEEQELILEREQRHSRTVASMGPNPWSFLAMKIRRSRAEEWDPGKEGS